MEPSTSFVQCGDVRIDDPKEKKNEEKLSPSIWEYIKEYCDCSSIQGLSYLTKDISLLEGCWWAIVFAICLSGCSYMVNEIVEKWSKSPVLVSLATTETSILRIPFPAVTFCPETKITRQCLNYSSVLRRINAGVADQIAQQEMEYFDYMAPLCRLENHRNSRRDAPMDDYTDFLDKCKSINLKDAFCQFMGEKKDCSELLTPIVTDNGLCYAFNMLDVRDIYSDVNQMKYFPEKHREAVWDIEEGYPDTTNLNVYPYRSFETGAQKSLIVTILTKKSDIYASCQDFLLQGIKVSLHTPTTIPRPAQISFPAGLDELVAVSVVPAMTSTTEEVKSYAPHKRYCYFERERQLKYFKRYSQNNCNMECWTNYTIQECGCVHFYMPRDANASICGPSKMQCLHDAEDSYSVSNFPKKYGLRRKIRGNLDNDCDCLPACSTLTYEAEFSRGVWKWNDPSGTEGRYMQKYFADYHASVIKVFFKTFHFLATEKSELYGISSFVSNAGGILGVFLGFSLFSLVEILYFSSVRLIENRRQYGMWLGKKSE